MGKNRRLALAAILGSTLSSEKGTELSTVKALLAKDGRLDHLMAIRKLEDRTDSVVLKQAAEIVVFHTFDQWFGQLITNIVTSRQDTAPKPPFEGAPEKKAA